MPQQNTLDINESSPLFYLEIAVNRPLFQTYTYASRTPVAIGCRVSIKLGHSNEVGIVIGNPTHSPEDFKINHISQVIDNIPTLSENIIKLLQWGSQYYFQPIGEFIFTFLPKYLKQANALSSLHEEIFQLKESGRTLILPNSAYKQQHALNTFIKSNTLNKAELKSHKISRTTLNELIKKSAISISLSPPIATQTIESSPSTLELNAEQTSAIKSVINNEGAFGCFLMEGITGSGKTEVYLNLCQHFLSQGQQVLLLVPEIGLTPQLFERIQQHLNFPVITLHSNIAIKERAKRWLQTKQDNPMVVIGTRSAVACNLPNLGCIIMDEEHDASFKQQEGIRYHSRSLAIKRAQQAEIPILLGTATPSLESLHNLKTGNFKALTLTQRASGAQLPEITIEDTNALTPNQIICEPARKAIEDTLNNQQQVLVFINRRGFAPSLQCSQCHWVGECNHCDVAMTVHQNTQSLECHHCDTKVALPQRCPNCNSPYLAPMGFGTERIEQTLQAEFPNTQILRMDRDSTQNKGSLEKIRNTLLENQPCILVGTQMVAKGHDFPNLTLTLVLNSDNGLYSQDFRAKEVLMQNLIQVAGRSGRGKVHGKVIIQSNYPDHPFFQDIIKQNYRTFAESELTHRQRLALAPSSYSAVIRMQSLMNKDGLIKLQQIEHALNNYKSQQGNYEIEISTTSPALIEKKSNWYRYVIMVSCPNRKQLHHYLSYALQLLKQTPRTKKIKWVIDVDPLDTL